MGRQQGKPGPDSMVGLGMTNHKFRRRFRLVGWVMGFNGISNKFCTKYGLRTKLYKRVSDGLFPRYRDHDAMCAALGMSREVFCGPESTLIEHLRRRRAWELAIDTRTWSSSEG